MKKLTLITAMLATSFNTYAGCAVPVIMTGSTSQTQTENRVFAGLAWTLKDKFSIIPDLTLGFRSLRVKSSDHVNGAEISARVKFQDGISLDSTRLSYIGGQRDLLGNVGIGYSFSHASLLGTVAAQGPYTRIGTDFQLSDKTFVPFFELLTVDKPHNVSRKQTTNTNVPAFVTMQPN